MRTDCGRVTIALRRAGVTVRMHGEPESYGWQHEGTAWVLPLDALGNIRVGVYHYRQDCDGDSTRRLSHLGDIIRAEGIPITMHPAGGSWVVGSNSELA